MSSEMVTLAIMELIGWVETEWMAAKNETVNS